ncbi:hypothetical protein [Desnuesiella massiliensis]|uniref:hypothetical protein n=1 Tax=Desnuesiella massiliensis TaxID=1650662 RepID=UPI0006E3AAB2|nr:hypothetical protein [Desnuesiella massiliensis]
MEQKWDSIDRLIKDSMEYPIKLNEDYDKKLLNRISNLNNDVSINNSKVVTLKNIFLNFINKNSLGLSFALSGIFIFILNFTGFQDKLLDAFILMKSLSAFFISNI